MPNPKRKHFYAADADVIVCDGFVGNVAFAEFKKRVDYSEYGGAPLLGVKGVCIIAHGRSNANAIKNAIRVAAEFTEGQVNQRIEEELAGWTSAPAAD
jgi:fatty acid/phospholipid biosynthesis enzyme